MEKYGAFAQLKKEVIDSGICCRDGACAAFCPTGAIKFEGGLPTLGKPSGDGVEGRCIQCGLCYNICPRTGAYEDEVKKRYLDGDETIGKYLGIHVCEAADEEIKKRAQDGGVVTALLKYAMDKNLIHGAVVAKRDEKWKSYPALAMSSEEILESAGTKYTVTSNYLVLTPFKEVLKKFEEREVPESWVKLAFVGTPCQILPLRKAEAIVSGAKIRPSNLISFTIGLFCMENFNYEKLIEEKVVRELGISTESVKKFDIKKGNFRIFLNGEVKEIPLSELNEYIAGGCKVCTDFASNFADISVGSVGAPEGKSTVIVRTEKGMQIYLGALREGYIRELPEAPKIKAIKKLAKLKMKKH
ncbi:MAG: Coenzyme F420 hydrogenase/dehydrogenase, beta subunit C-terminal domain [Archaeoglobi archaeon]|nr:Coenzyme F420 hydrogenase/dehydrogenase, beta subunit C-terminal domain [Candidatus Mnemosynella bozhongmuii]